MALSVIFEKVQKSRQKLICSYLTKKHDGNQARSMPFVHLKSGTPTITLSFIAPINLQSMVVQLELESMAERLPDVTYSDFRNFKYLLLGCWGTHYRNGSG